MTNRYKTILSLCDYSGGWSEPYREAGYKVRQVDIKLLGNEDVRLLSFPGPVYGILAAPPCTHFAIVGARHWKNKTDADLIEGLSIVDACIRIAMMTKPKFWALENPVGRLRNYLGAPQFSFQPCDYGDAWTKKTYLWGNFVAPLPLFVGEDLKVEPEKYTGKTGRNYGRTQLMSGHNRQEARSETPKGFARAFFMANQ